MEKSQVSSISETPDKLLIMRVFTKSLMRLSSVLKKFDRLQQMTDQKTVQNPEHFHEMGDDLLEEIYNCLQNTWSIADKAHEISSLTQQILELDENNHDTD